MYIKRDLRSIIENHFFSGKAIIVLGARQVGKSTMLERITQEKEIPALFLNCDDPDVRTILTEINTVNLDLLIGKNKIVFIDEAQRVNNIGVVLKMVVDRHKDLQLLVSGSSSLHLRSSINEPLTGRKYEYVMYPIATSELYDTMGLMTTRQLLNFRLIFGSYPDVLTHPDEARELLKSLSDSYLYKDILDLEDIRKPVVLNKILIALALQVGSEVSYNEVARTVGSDPKTVEKYVDLLEKCFVVFTLTGLSRNMRNELKKTKKIYFYDIGIRNAIIQNYAPVELRNDIGALWENFFISERIKNNSYSGRLVNYYFWRTTSQQEIDLIEESDGQFYAFEMKWNPEKGNVKFPQSFIDAYNPREINVVTPENYLNYLL
ncbi:MAG: ATP-binding protein [Muribaculaceae bacterium]|nr:ATP-binding protein [Muribaculaceae bacterium]